MSAGKAQEIYLGKSGEKLNCSQAIISAFQGKFSLPEEMLAECKAYGGGKAPGGECGAYYAAKMILKRHFPGKLDEFESIFGSQAGSVRCGEIRSLRRLTCLGCVGKAGEFLEKL